jgi:hypothetical protein
VVSKVAKTIIKILLKGKVMLKIDNVKIYDLCESIVASGLPMQASYTESQFYEDVIGLDMAFDLNTHNITVPDLVKNNKHYKRACKLANNPSSSGHPNFLTGIQVSMNITAPVKWWEQWQRYHFQQIVSSQSTMHRLREMLKSDNPYIFDAGVNPEVVTWLVNNADKMTDEELAYNCPMGLHLTARVNLNYMQIRNIYHQRKMHKLKAWREFCDWVKTLPLAEEFILVGGEK